jgi:hypothetical protein
MDAKELTQKYFKDHQDIYELKKQVEYLTNEVTLLRRFVDDMKIDIKMLQNVRRGG